MVTPAKVVGELNGKETKQDILDVIKQHCLKFKPVSEPCLSTSLGKQVFFTDYLTKFDFNWIVTERRVWAVEANSGQFIRTWAPFQAAGRQIETRKET